ncbi:hypothetical protein CKM354_000820000 [Cercospora kikuchii]|uniref:Uncharacterized protein n=1 Tax=Cercospora kikuchii TaxID=84275 RepID=A0A9P3FF28_9PEZI|nr:uncharacterized protein CKM354_000820000 [Cercospora kikuchii]GIZ45016.1 hypothetical protein CKM354_000820000 [Cercospora kikuchii]
MFSNARPVPSKAALKVLYQLAYISSGTAVGVATLCAEERRRRTLVVQKIADNAKRIRQSPQHVRNRRRRSADESREKHAISAGEEVLGAAFELEERAVRAAELPSAVENGYEQVAQQAGRTRRRLRGSSKRHPRENVEDRNNSVASCTSEDAPNEQSMGSATQASIVRSVHVPSQARSMDPGLAPQGIIRKIRFGLDHLKTRSDGREDRQRPIRPPRLHTLEAFQRSSRVSPPSIDHTYEAAKDVMWEVEKFFVSAARVGAAGVDQHWKHMASSLLHLSAMCGMRLEVKQLMKWLAKFDALSPELILMICGSCRRFLQRPRAPMHSVLLLYRSLFKMPIFAKQVDALRVRAQLAVVEGIASFSGGIVDKKQISMAYIELCDSELLVRELTTRHETLCAHRDHQLAHNLVFSVLESTTVSNESRAQYEELVDQCIKSSINGGKLACSVQLWLKGYAFFHNTEDGNSRFGRRLSHVATLARRTRSIDLLEPICRRLAETQDRQYAVLDFINEDCKVSLAMACIAMEAPPMALLEKLYSGLTQPRKEEVLFAQADAQLKEMWQSTRSLPAVFAAYENFRKARAHLIDEQVWAGSVGAPEMALIEICNLAGQPDRGLQILSSAQITRLESADSFSLAALTLATKNSWEAFATLISTAADSQLSIADDRVATNRLDHAVMKHGQRHSAAETWEFISGLVARVRFVPTAATARTMLRKLASEMTPDEPSPILDWLHYMQSFGVESVLDADTVTTMFRSHYREVRTPHTLLMHFSRRLYRAVPYLQAGSLRGIVKEAIAYDMRELDTKYQQAVQLAAEINLQRVTENSEIIPLPIGRTQLQTRAGIQKYRSSQKEQMSGVRENPLPSADAKHDLHDVHPASEGNVRWEPNDIPLGSRQGALVEAESPDLMAEISDDAAIEPFERVIQDYYAAEDDAAMELSPRRKETARTTRDALSADRETVAPATAGVAQSTLGQPQVHRRESENSKQDIGRLPTRIGAFSGKQEIGYSGHGSSVSARKQVSNMVLEYSAKRFVEVLDLYEKSLGPTGRPSSPLALSVAVQARIRLDNGAIDGAKQIMLAAQDAGFNASCASAPILIREMRMMRREDKRDLAKLRDRVMEYYLANARNGWPVSHYVGVSAANLLIDNHEPALGIDLLNFVCRDRWGSHDPPDIVTMTVFLKGFKALKHLKGIIWVVRKVLGEKMRITRNFLHRLRTSPKAFERFPHLPRSQRKSVDPMTLRRLKTVRVLCIHQRMVQRNNARRLGFKFVAVLRLAARYQQASSDEERQYLVQLEHEYYKRRSGEGSTILNKQVTQMYTACRARSRCRRIARASFRKEWLRTRFGERQKTTAVFQSLRARQYRQFKKANPAIPGGRPVSLKQYLALLRSNNGKLPKDLSGKPSSKAAYTPLLHDDTTDGLQQQQRPHVEPFALPETREESKASFTSPLREHLGDMLVEQHESGLTKTSENSRLAYTPPQHEGATIGPQEQRDGFAEPMSTKAESKTAHTPLLHDGPQDNPPEQHVEFTEPVSLREESQRGHVKHLRKIISRHILVQADSSSKALYAPSMHYDVGQKLPEQHAKFTKPRATREESHHEKIEHSQQSTLREKPVLTYVPSD